MVVTLQFYTELLKGKPAPDKVHAMFTDYFEGEPFVKVMPFGKEADYNGFLAGNTCSGWDGIEIYVTEMRIGCSSARVLTTSEKGRRVRQCSV